MPCQAATLTPNAPQEQSRSPRASTSTNQHHVYTFFCTAVTPSPAFEFPAACYVRAHETAETTSSVPGALSSSAESASGLGGAGAYAGFAGQGWEGMAGMPTGEESEYTYGYTDEQDEPGEYDADGVQIPAEPGSPDKPSVELMFLPAR